MTPKQRFIHALTRKPPIPGEHVPHFELVFYLTMEAIGQVHPAHLSFSQWDQLSESERELHRGRSADNYVEIARKYHHDAIFAQPNPGSPDETIRMLEKIRERSGDDFFLMLHGDPTFPIPNGSDMMEFAAAFVEEPDKMKQEAQRRVDQHIRAAEKFAARPELLDGFALCSDYCFNTAPFFRPGQFAEFITPYLTRIIQEYRDMGFYTIKHTDGNILPILDQLVQANPHALHSLDPQGGVDLREVKAQWGDRVCLIGNVNCGLLQTGEEDEVRADVRRALRDGMPSGGYIFSTSNCAYSGLPLSRYELMHDIWRAEGRY